MMTRFDATFDCFRLPAEFIIKSVMLNVLKDDRVLKACLVTLLLKDPTMKLRVSQLRIGLQPWCFGQFSSLELLHP